MEQDFGIKLVEARYFWMYDRDGVRNHDKVWMIEMAERDDGFVVMRRWGRRGTKLSQKVEMFPHTYGGQIKAQSNVAVLIDDKLAKGYEEVDAEMIGVESHGGVQ